MFDNMHEAYPDMEFWVLENKSNGDEMIVTYERLLSAFGEERLMRIQNNFDRSYALRRHE